MRILSRVMRQAGILLLIAALTLSLPTASARSPDRQTTGGVFTVRSGDTTPPACITDLRIGSVGLCYGASIILYWTAPGDDGMEGTATLYDIRYARAPILTEADWEAATPLAGVPAPRPAGSAESFVVRELEDDGGPYYFCIRAADEVFNWSCLSNSPGTRVRVPGMRPFRVYLIVARDYHIPAAQRAPVRERRALARAR